MKSALVLDGRFRVFEDGSINKIRNGKESPATIYYTSRDRRYAVVSFMQDGKQKHEYVHRLIAMAFIPNPNGWPQVNHKDGNSRNNAADNLEWCTPSMNIQHAYDIGLIDRRKSKTPCTVCGAPSRTRNHICTKCRLDMESTERLLHKRKKQMIRFSGYEIESLGRRQREYVQFAAIGFFPYEIADLYGVSRQAVSSALSAAERMNAEHQIVEVSA